MLPVTVVRRLIRVKSKVSKSKILQIAVMVVFLSVFFASLFSHFEGVGFFTAFYRAVIPMATIGYGDVTPKTEAGRIVAMVAAVAVISTFRSYWPQSSAVS